jgi:hypothetical protein
MPDDADRPADADPAPDDFAGGDHASADAFAVVDDSDAAEAPTEPEAMPRRGERAMDALRVRQLSAVRRSTYRARSYCVVALGVCAVAAAQLVLLTVRHVRHAGWQLRPIGYVCGIGAAAMAGAFFFRRAAELSRELRTPPAALADPQSPPDFSTLSDGSQTWKNLEQMREGG